MSVFTKGKLKALKEALASKDWPGVERNANHILDFESNNYNARVFLALALFHRGEFEDSEKNYNTAISSAPQQVLARQGLATFLEKRGRWSDYASSLQELMKMFYESQDANKYAETLQKLISVRRTHGTRPELIEALSYLLPGSSAYPLLMTLPPAAPTEPLASSFHFVQISMLSALPTLLEVIELTEAEESELLESEIKRRRQRLGGNTSSASETRKLVNAEQMRHSKLPGLYRTLLDDADASSQEDLRRQTEVKLLNHSLTLLQSLPSSFDGPSLDLRLNAKSAQAKKEEDKLKATVRDEVEELARGMVVIGVQNETSWDIVLEWKDKYANWELVNWAELCEYADLFPNAGLARIIQTLKPPPERSASTESSEAPVTKEEDVTDTMETAIADCPQSILAHLAAAHYFRKREDWEAVVQIAERAIILVTECERKIGRALPLSRRTSETHLAIALVNLDPPKHHLQASRMLDALIASFAEPSVDLWSSKALVQQHAEQWFDAVESWDRVLKAGPGSIYSRAATEGSQAWCHFKAGNVEAAITSLQIVVEAFESRKVLRDGEQKEKEKIRSKAGVERPEGLQEGETKAEAMERAQSWWRLGSCLWHLAESDPSKNIEAFDAFVASLKAYPDYAPAFTSLGIYYRSLSEPDYERASKCFQKAFELDGCEELAARYLAEEYASISEWDLVEAIARRVVGGTVDRGSVRGRNATRLAWAWKAIGGAELIAKRFPTAISAFQSALRCANNDVHIWVKLGIAYRASGKHVAAIKVLAKALELDPQLWYAEFLIADIQREIGFLGPAIKTLRLILAKHSSETGVAIVLAETYLDRGLEELSAGYLARAELSFLEALSQSVNVLENGSVARICWKVAGDSLSGLSTIKEPAQRQRCLSLVEKVLLLVEAQEVDEKIEIAKSITSKSVRSPFSLGSVEDTVLLQGAAVLAFKVRVLLETQSASNEGFAWFDLAIGIKNAKAHLLDTSQGDKEENYYLHEAIRCLKFALHKEPYNAVFWNALGVLSFDLSPRLAQHSFIKALELNTRSAIPWTNLGVFYIVHGDLDLANESFLKAQVLDPDLTPAWLGQAVLASMAGHTSECSTLLEHAFSLNSDTPEADIMFATDFYHRYQINSGLTTAVLATPLFAISRYLARRPDDVHALHLNALILEQINNLTDASDSLAKAVEILEELYELDESPNAEARFIVAQVTLGRVALARLKYSDALTAFESAQSLLDISTEIPGGLNREQSVQLLSECLLGSALSQYWLGNIGAAKKTLEMALEDMKGIEGSSTMKFNMALGRIYWSEGDENGALSSLMDIQDVVNPKSPFIVKLTMHALGILAGDSAILQLLRRINHQDPTAKYAHEATRLTVLSSYMKKDTAAALAVVSRTTHASPWTALARFRTANVLCEIASVPNAGAPNSPLIESCSRLLRTKYLGNENSTDRSARFRLSGTVRMAKEETEQEGFMMLAKAVYLAPWTTKARAAFLKVKNTTGFNISKAVPNPDEDPMDTNTEDLPW